VILIGGELIKQKISGCAINIFYVSFDKRGHCYIGGILTCVGVDRGLL
jgi:hypothetical protein